MLKLLNKKNILFKQKIKQTNTKKNILNLLRTKIMIIKKRKK